MFCSDLVRTPSVKNKKRKKKRKESTSHTTCRRQYVAQRTETDTHVDKHYGYIMCQCNNDIFGKESMQAQGQAHMRPPPTDPAGEVQLEPPRHTCLEHVFDMGKGSAIGVVGGGILKTRVDVVAPSSRKLFRRTPAKQLPIGRKRALLLVLNSEQKCCDSC